MSLGEFEIIDKYFAGRTGRADVQLGIGDDAAVLDVRSDRKLVLAMDTIVEGVHFLADSDPADIGHRALAVNLSDLAAMGAQPSWMSLSLSVRDADEAWLGGFASGLFELARRHDVQLIGGDTVRGPLVITIQVGGWVEPDRWLTRSGAQVGDEIFVSGVLGEAAAGLDSLRNKGERACASEYLQQRFLRPEPRVALGRALRSVATAAMDVSDGLLTDLDKFCAASGCGAHLDVDLLPRSIAMQGAYTDDERIRYALAGGDDYELLFTVNSSEAAQLTAGSIEGVPITKIGVIAADSGVHCVRNGRPFAPDWRGYDHFAQVSAV